MLQRRRVPNRYCCWQQTQQEAMCQQIAALVMLQRRRELNRYYCWQQAQQEAMDNSKWKEDIRNNN
jgi:hypothetical protein